VGAGHAHEGSVVSRRLSLYTAIGLVALVLLLLQAAAQDAIEHAGWGRAYAQASR